MSGRDSRTFGTYGTDGTSEDYSEPVCLSIARDDLVTEGKSFKRKTVDRTQPRIFSLFSARRSAARVEGFFVKAMWQRCRIVVFVLSFVFLIGCCFWVYVETEQSIATFFNGIAEDVMRATVQSVLWGVGNWLREGIYIAVTTAQLVHPDTGIFPVNASGATDITQLFYGVIQVSTRTFLYGLAKAESESDKCFIAMDAASDEVCMLWADSNGIMYRFIAENGRNSSFPDDTNRGDVIESSYYASDRIWYKIAEERNRTTWTDQFMGSGSVKGRPIMMGVSPLWYDNAVSAVVEAGILLDDFDAYLQQSVPSVRSRLAIVDDNGVVISISGMDSRDIYNGEVVTKKLTEVVDSVWQQVLQSEQWESKDDFTVTIEGAMYLVSQLDLDVNTEEKYALCAVVCVTDLFSVSAEYGLTNFLFMSLILVVAFVIAATTTYVARYCVAHEQTEILVDKQQHRNNHLKSAGTARAVAMLYRLIRSHGDNDDVLKSVQDIVSSLCCVGTDLVFDRTALFNGIGDRRIVNKLTQIYGCFEKGGSMDCSLFLRHQSNPDGKDSDKENGRINAPVVTSADMDIFAKRSATFALSNDIIVDETMKIMKDINKEFDNDPFQCFVARVFSLLGDDIALILFDSLELAGIIIERIAEEMLTSEDCLVIIVALLSWHLAMGDRKNKREQIQRYFCNDTYVLSVAARSILSVLKDIPHSVNMNFPDFAMKVMDVVNATPLRNQIREMARSQMFVGGGRNRVRGSPVAMRSVMKCVCGVSTVSFLLHDADSVALGHSLLNPDPLSSENARFYSCLTASYGAVFMKSLKELCGKEWVEGMCS